MNHYAANSAIGIRGYGAAKCWGDHFNHNISCPTGTTCGNTSSPGGLLMATCRGDHLVA